MIYALPQTGSAISHRECLILVVDDETPILMLVQDVLEDEGYNVMTASSGQDALRIAQNEELALVLTDLMMPHMDGIEFSVALRCQPRTADLPIILMSAAMPSKLELRFDGFVAKPFAIEQLVSEVHALCAVQQRSAAA